jgi:hypothetical protein
MRMLAIIALVAVLAALTVAGAETPPGQTVLDWRQAGQKAATMTLCADGTFANAAGERKNYRWLWTDEGLLLRFYSGRFVLKPVPGEPGRFTGQSVPRTPTEAVAKVDVTLRQPDGAGVLLWLQPLTDGVEFSAVERRAAVEAHNVVVGRLHTLGAKLDAAAAKANRAAASLFALDDAEAAAGDRTDVSAETVHVARHEEWEAHKWVHRTFDPYYSLATFQYALADWCAWQDRRESAEADLDRARADLSKATDRRVRAEADLRVAEAEYIIARSDYESAYWLAWRPEYLRRKAILKAQATKVQQLNAGPPKPR